MNDFWDLFRHGFLLQNALLGSLAVGFFCPLIGTYFLLRRMVLLGAALPQVSAAGISFVFFLEGLGITWSLHPGEAHDRALALAGSAVCTLAAIMVLAIFERRGTGSAESRIGAVWAGAYALAIMLVFANPTGKIEVLNMLHGEIVSVSPQDLHLLLGVFSVLSFLLLIFNRHFLFVSFDRETARVMGENVWVWDTLLYLIIGIALSVGVLIVGPMPTFAFLIIPPLAARRFCRRMGTFFWLSSCLGGVGGFAGFYASYHYDTPLGPTAILATVTLLGICVLTKRIFLKS